MMVFSACALAATLIAAGPSADGPTPPNDEAQLPSRVARNSDTVDTQFLQPLEAEDVNGRLWVGRPIIGGMDHPLRDRRQDGAARYGAYGEGDSTIVVSIDGLFHFESQRLAEVRPFESVTDRADVGNPYSNSFSSARKKLAQRLEDARQQWLRDNNYVGGVRTFVNDAVLLKPADQKTSGASSMPEPRGVIELAPDTPRFKSRMRVQSDPVAPPHARRTAGVIKVLPKAAPVEESKQAAKEATPDSKPGATETHAPKTTG